MRQEASIPSRAPHFAPAAVEVEHLSGGGMILRDTLRYAHGEEHVRAALDEAKLALVSLARASTRNEKNVPVPGLVVVARK